MYISTVMSKTANIFRFHYPIYLSTRIEFCKSSGYNTCDFWGSYCFMCVRSGATFNKYLFNCEVWLQRCFLTEVQRFEVKLQSFWFIDSETTKVICFDSVYKYSTKFKLIDSAIVESCWFCRVKIRSFEDSTTNFP